MPEAVGSRMWDDLESDANRTLTMFEPEAVGSRIWTMSEDILNRKCMTLELESVGSRICMIFEQISIEDLRFSVRSPSEFG